MQRRTVLAVVVLLSALGVAAVAGFSASGADLTERWVSDTPRDNQVNHHPVGVGPNGTIVAPVAAVAGTEGIGPTSCALVRLDPTSGAVLWRAGVRPANCTTHALTAPAIADVDGDGSPEVVGASTEQALHVRAASTGEERWRVPLDSFGYGQPAVADLLTDEPGREIVVTDIDGEVSLVANRSVRWRHDRDASTWADPIVADVAGDGRREIVVGTNDGTVAFTPRGDVVWASGAAGKGTALGPIVDGRRLVLSAGRGTVRALDGATGDGVWSTDLGGTTAIVAVRTDAEPPTAYVGVAGGRVVALDATTGEARWTSRLVTEQRVVTPPPVPADVDGDGTPELVAVAGDGTVSVLDAAGGAELASYQRDVPIYTRVTPTDLDDDGAAEILVRYGDGRVVALDYE